MDNTEQALSRKIADLVRGRGVENVYPGDSVETKVHPCIQIDVQRGEPDPEDTNCYIYDAVITARARTPEDLRTVGGVVESILASDLDAATEADDEFVCFDAKFQGSSGGDTDKTRSYTRSFKLWMTDLRATVIQ